MNTQQQSAAKLPASRGRRPDGDYQKKCFTKGSPYTPGQFDNLLAPKEYASPEDLLGISLELTGKGLDLVEHTRNGHHPRHHLRSFPASIDLILPSGEMVWVEIRSIGGDVVSYRTPEEIAAEELEILMGMTCLLVFDDRDEE